MAISLRFRTELDFCQKGKFKRKSRATRPLLGVWANSQYFWKYWALNLEKNSENRVSDKGWNGLVFGQDFLQNFPYNLKFFQKQSWIGHKDLYFSWKEFGLKPNGFWTTQLWSWSVFTEFSENLEFWLWVYMNEFEFGFGFIWLNCSFALV